MNDETLAIMGSSLLSRIGELSQLNRFYRLYCETVFRCASGQPGVVLKVKWLVKKLYDLLLLKWEIRARAVAGGHQSDRATG